MKTGEVVRRIWVGKGGVTIRRADGSTSRLPYGATAWVPLDAQIDGTYVVQTRRTITPIENKSEAS